MTHINLDLDRLGVYDVLTFYSFYLVLDPHDNWRVFLNYDKPVLKIKLICFYGLSVVSSKVFVSI